MHWVLLALLHLLVSALATIPIALLLLHCAAPLLQLDVARDLRRIETLALQVHFIPGAAHRGHLLGALQLGRGGADLTSGWGAAGLLNSGADSLLGAAALGAGLPLPPLRHHALRRLLLLKLPPLFLVGGNVAIIRY